MDFAQNALEGKKNLLEQATPEQSQLSFFFFTEAQSIIVKNFQREVKSYRVRPEIEQLLSPVLGLV